MSQSKIGNKDSNAQFNALGQEIIRMLRHLQSAPPEGDTGYVIRTFTYPGGAFHLLMTENPEVAAAMEKGVAESFNVKDLTLPSTPEVN